MTKRKNKECKDKDWTAHAEHKHKDTWLDRPAQDAVGLQQVVVVLAELHQLALPGL